MEKLELDSVVKLSLITGALLVGFSFFYYFVIFLPQREKTRLEKATEMDARRDICLQTALSADRVLWNAKCAELRLGDNCNLPSEIADPMDANLKYARDGCFKKYPQN